MGGGQSVMPDSTEKENWSQAHSLQIDESLRQSQVPKLACFKQDLYVCFVFVSLKCDKYPSKDYRHYFITDKEQILEFGRGSLPRAALYIGKHEYKETSVEIEKEIQFNDAVRRRMEEVCGACGHSWCLRSSEHLVKYVASGSWVSQQMLPGTEIFDTFAPHMTPDQKKLINTLPHEIERREKIRIIRPLYREAKAFLDYKGTKSVLTKEEADEAMNIVMLGPTGSGKSNIINLMFNKVVCASRNSANSVTRNMQIIQGAPRTKVGSQSRPVNVIDTIGFCDSEMPPEDVIALVKQHIKTTFLKVDRVVIVCASGRLERAHRQSIKNVMEWLQFKTYAHNFTLVLTKADLLSEEDREQCLVEVCEAIGLSSKFIKPNQGTLLPSSIMKGRTENVRTAVSLQVAACLPPTACYAHIEEELHNVLDATCLSLPTTIPVDPARMCTVL